MLLLLALLMAVCSAHGHRHWHEHGYDHDHERKHDRTHEYKIRDVHALPEGFILGTASSAYQVEGGWDEDGKGLSVWDYLLHTDPNCTVDGSNGDIAADSYHNYKEDVALVKAMGLDVYRFSVSWPRVLPTGDVNVINHKGIEYYNRLIDHLLKNGITPVVTMYHWDLPQELQNLGGWTNPIIVDYFAEYARVLYSNFGDRVKWWVTINEPDHVAGGYEDSGSLYRPVAAPALSGNRRVGSYLAGHNLLRAHAAAYELYDRNFRRHQNGRVAIVLSCYNIEPSTTSAEDVDAARRAFHFQTGWFAHPVFSAEGDYPRVMRERVDMFSKQEGRARSRLPYFTYDEVRSIRGSSDFFGLNTYTTQLARANDSFDDSGASLHANPNWKTSVAKWLQVVPWGLRSVLNKVSRDYPQYLIFITENGFADAGELNDLDRIDFIVSYMQEMLKAIYYDQVPVIGYIYWSLLDSFEWVDGYRNKFGLVSVDFKDPSRRRRVKHSAKLMADIARHRRLPETV